MVSLNFDNLEINLGENILSTNDGMAKQYYIILLPFYATDCPPGYALYKRNCYKLMNHGQRWQDEAAKGKN